MEFRKEEIICITCKHFPCFPYDQEARHTGQLSVDYNLVYDRPFPCSTFKTGRTWEPNELLKRTKKRREDVKAGVL